MTAAKFPRAKVKLIGKDGNAWAILGNVSRAMRAAGCSDADIADYMRDATSSDYAHLLAVTMRTVEVL